MSRVIGVLRARSRLWLTVLLAGVATQQILSYLLMGFGVPGGFSAGMVVGSAVIAGSIALWIPYRGAVRWSSWEEVFFASILILWLITIISSVVRGNVFSLIVVWLPVALVLIWWKRSDSASVQTATRVFAWILVVGMLGYLVLQVVSVLPQRASDGRSPDYELTNYWLPLAGVLGLPARWAGPFGHPNLVSPVGPFLIVLGCVQPRWTRVTFISAGVLILVLTGTRSSLIAAAAGVLILLVAQRGWLQRGRSLWAIEVFAAVGFLVVVVGLLAMKPSLTGRTEMWPNFISLWNQSPLTGIGDPGITLAIQAGTLPGWAVHGHNVLLDALVRYGIAALIMVIVVFVVAGIVTGRAAAERRGLGPGILTTVIVGGLTESPLDRRYLNVMMVILLVSVLLAAGARETGSSA